MASNGTLLIEIGVEELPAIPFLKEKPFIMEKFQNLLQEYRLDGDLTWFYTPRRIVFLGRNFSLKQKASVEEFFGPPLEIAYKNNQPTKAFEAFIKRSNIDPKDITHRQKDGKEVLYYQREILGKESQAILGEILEKFLSSLQFGKSMRWGSGKESFIRPIRSLVVMIDDDLVPMELYGIQSAKKTFIHRSISFEAFSFDTQEDYAKLLESHGIILDSATRKNRILEGIKNIEKDSGLRVEIDSDLLDEIVAITEYPTPLLGYFDQAFLSVPPEMIVSSMKENQRYFALYTGNTLSNAFVVVSNAHTDDSSLIIKGNEKVLKARLADALFFYKNDLQKGFQTNQLAHVRFMEGLGSMLDKSHREEKIASMLAELYQERLCANLNMDFTQIQSLIHQTSQITKSDLLSESVYEFTELQGVIGSYMAKHFGFDPLICSAIREQYLPKTQDDPLPSHLFSALFALAYRLDNLFALFSIGKIPSGSKDPFSLRRAVNGILRIIIHYQLPFDIRKILALIASLYQDFDRSCLEHFILERIQSFYSFNPSIVSAVLNTQERDVNEIDKKLKALDDVLTKSKTISATFKRVANITKDIDLNHLKKIDTEILNATEEIELHAHLESFWQQTFKHPKEELEYLMSFGPILDRFFNVVLVNAPDERLRENRKTLIAHIYKAFLKIADIKEIAL